MGAAQRVSAREVGCGVSATTPGVMGSAMRPSFPSPGPPRTPHEPKKGGWG
jgi:hypothetical protein